MPSPKVRRGIYWSERTKTWRYEFKLDGQKYNGNTGHSNEKFARDWVVLKKAALKNAEVGILPDPEPPPPALTLARLVELYREKRSGGDPGSGAITDHTLAVVELRMRLHWQDLADRPIDQITAADVEDLRQKYLTGEGRRSKGGANKVVATLRTVLGWAMQRGLVAAVPFKIPNLKQQKAVQAVVWPEQLRPFLRASRACRNADARLALMACLTMGLREGEALGLRWQWFDWTAQIYRVGEAKDRDVRAIPMHPLFRRVMRTRWLAQGKPHHGLVLPAEEEVPHHPGYLRKPVENTAHRLGIVGLHPHRLRASFATGAWEAGASIAQIQAWLGHEDPSTSMLYIVQRDLDGRQVQARAAEAAGWKTFTPKKKILAKPKTLRSSQNHPE
jgi:integrase